MIQAMPSLKIKTLISLATVSIVYAYVCQILLTQKAGKLARWLQQQRPELWSEMNSVARNWHGGLPALKVLKRRNVVDLPEFDREFEKLYAMERKLFWGIGICVLCFGALVAGFLLLGWHW